MFACPPHAVVNGLEVQNQLELMMVSWRQQPLHLGFRFCFIRQDSAVQRMFCVVDVLIKDGVNEVEIYGR